MGQQQTESKRQSPGAMNAYGDAALPDGFNFLSGIDEAGEYNYWKHVDYIVQQARQRGIYIAIVCVWGGNVKSGNWNVILMKDTLNRKNLWRKHAGNERQTDLSGRY
ncbi:MAG: DUF4038 domain-containing protein [Tannerella sp.]|nr:DUF4038 domain-containing protein [Tannerella sp.]